MIRWEKIDRTVSPHIGTVITYRGVGTGLIIQSRKRPIKNANGVGTWDYTSYFVMCEGQDIKECWRLSEAKEYAELLQKEKEAIEKKMQEVLG